MQNDKKSGIAFGTEKGPVTPEVRQFARQVLAPTNVVQWWSIDREGQLIDPTNPELHAPRHAGSPPLEDDSPYTPSDYDENGEMMGTHLHYVNGQIIGLHGKATLRDLRSQLFLCLMYEERILAALQKKNWQRKAVPYNWIWTEILGLPARN